MGYPLDNIPTWGQELGCLESQHPDSGQDFVCPENLVELPATFCRLGTAAVGDAHIEEGQLALQYVADDDVIVIASLSTAALSSYKK